jgi:hypothetical protein
LNDIPVFHDLTVLDPKDLNDGDATLARSGCHVNVEENESIFCVSNAAFGSNFSSASL